MLREQADLGQIVSQTRAMVVYVTSLRLSSHICKRRTAKSLRCLEMVNIEWLAHKALLKERWKGGREREGKAAGHTERLSLKACHSRSS